MGAPSLSASPAPLRSVHRSTARSPALPLLTHPQRGGMVFNNVAFWGLNHCTEDEDGGRINSPRLPARPPPGLGQAACSFRRQFVALGCSGCFSKQRSELGFSVHPGEQRAGERGAGGSRALPDGRRGVPGPVSEVRRLPWPRRNTRCGCSRPLRATGRSVPGATSAWAPARAPRPGGRLVPTRSWWPRPCLSVPADPPAPTRHRRPGPGCTSSDRLSRLGKWGSAS